MLVIDTNIWVSYALNRKGSIAVKLKAAIDQQNYAFSDATFRELTEVFLRKKFDPYFSKELRVQMLKEIARGAEWFNPTETVTACRDPKDNKFLELAIASNAAAIITGDQDLLTLNPYRNTRVVTISDFLFDDV